jgi:hypothetical protein
MQKCAVKCKYKKKKGEKTQKQTEKSINNEKLFSYLQLSLDVSVRLYLELLTHKETFPSKTIT